MSQAEPARRLGSWAAWGDECARRLRRAQPVLATVAAFAAACAIGLAVSTALGSGR